MAVEIVTTLPLNQVQTFFGFILSILGIGWFITLSNVIKIRAIYQINNYGRTPILESIVPTNIIEVFKILRINMSTPVLITSIVFIFSLLFTAFDSLIIPNTITYNESCKEININTQAKITAGTLKNVLWIHSEVEKMKEKRSKSGVPDGVLVGQIPEDTRWKFNSQLDVDPYPWRTSYSLYKSGVTQVNMNNSFFSDLGRGRGRLEVEFPELHAEYIFNNVPEGYTLKDSNYLTFMKYGKTKTDDVVKANGILILSLELFTNGNASVVASKHIYRLWTLRVPETTKIPLTNKFEIVPVPIVVKAYSCKIERVKEGYRGSYSFDGIDAILDIVGSLIANKWSLAIINGNDSSIYEFTPEYLASFLSVKGSISSPVEEVLAQISVSCIKIHPIYILLVYVYTTMIIISCICWYITKKNNIKIPSNIIDWVNLICKDSAINNDNILINQVTLGIISNNIKIFPKNELLP